MSRSPGLVNVLDGALCVGVFTALAPGLVGLLLMDRLSPMIWCRKV